jgi:hypothetical protein
LTHPVTALRSVSGFLFESVDANIDTAYFRHHTLPILSKIDFFGKIDKKYGRQNGALYHNLYLGQHSLLFYNA